MQQHSHLFAVPSPAASSTAQPRASHLPIPLTSLLGRERELAHLTDLVRRPDPPARLLTLTGPGGVGKTRLLLALGHNLVHDFADGVVFVRLAAIRDPDFVLPAIAQALDLPQLSVRSLLSDLQTFIGERSLLLLLDNFEQVLAAAPQLAELLTHCPNLHVVVSSRAALRLSGEQEWSLAPLELPDAAHLPLGATSLLTYAACALFVQRAQAIDARFQVKEATVQPIAEICLRLDGLPLAIELAAARTRLLSPQALLARLEHRLEVLTDGTRNLPTRQQTLRATIAWSYHLLTPEEQQLFRLLAVFIGGCTLEAAETLTQAVGLAADRVLDGVSTLLENHLLRQREQANGEPRLLMLETIREYGLECLQTEGEKERAHQEHARYYVALAEEAGSHFGEPEEVRWLDLLEGEHENLRAVLQRAMVEDTEAIDDAWCLGTVLAWFWHVRGYASDGHRWLAWVQTAQRGNAAVRTKALNQGAILAIWLDQYELAQILGRESLAIYRELGDSEGIAQALFWLGDATQNSSEYAAARPLLEEALLLYQHMGDQQGMTFALAALAYGATTQGDFSRALALVEEALAIASACGDKQGIIYALLRLVRCLYLSQTDPTRALALAQECLALSREVGYKQGIAAAFSNLSLLALQQGDANRARSYLEETLRLRRELASPWDLAKGMYYLANLHLVQGDPTAARACYETCLDLLQQRVDDREFLASYLEGLAETIVAQRRARWEISWAAQAGGAAEALREAIDAPLPPVRRTAYARALTLARSLLDEPTFRAAWAEGRGMTPEHVLATRPAVKTVASILLEAHPPNKVSPATSTTAPASPTNEGTPDPAPVDLTARELEVLRLVAEGLTNPQIAERLVISSTTVRTHLTAIFAKLRVNSRSAATRYAVERHLI